jgi:2-polyprenyl-6-hydroxyphenyl methylase/3-demethylubiquinone-9 3-methyltransferase
VSQRYWNQEAARTTGEVVGFSFGENWRKYLGRLTPDRIRQAEASLAESFGGAPIAGERFIDVGCGSGLFSFCAGRLGAATITSVDVDPNSVACAKELKRQSGNPPNWAIRTGSVLDAGFLRTIEPGTRVYCWGVLHHTGAMWSAIENALWLVAPGGLLCLALYNRPRHLAVHMALKRAYNRLARPFRPALVGAYAALLFGVLSLKGRNPVRYVREYGKRARGMSFWRDVEDWLGGLPFEFASEADVTRFVTERGFSVERVLRRPPGANNEYLLRRSG